MQSGEFDRKIIIQARTATQDTDGGEIFKFTTFATVFAKYKTIKASERFSSNIIQQSKVITFVIRYIPNIKADMRINYNNEYFKIIGIAESGRRKYIELTSEFLTMSGES